MTSKVMLVVITLVNIISLSKSAVILEQKSKRSPLEIGYVQFTIPTPSHQDSSSSLQHGVGFQIPMTLIVHSTNISTVHHDTKADHMLPAHPNYRDEWIPGHVVNHVFIPGKVHHVLVPVVAHPVHAVLVHSVHVKPVYRKYYGGFGVGVDTGGRGAGHGFYVL